MVNISKLTSMATKAFSAVRKMPTAGKVGMAALFGAGMLAGNMLTCDGFEKEQKAPEKPKTEVKADTTTVTKPEAKEVKEEEKFEYVPPKIGEFGVAKVDTLYYNDGSGKMSIILYKNKSGHTVHQTNFNKDGSLKEYYILTNPKDEEFEKYNSKGELIYYTNKLPNGNIEHHKKTDNGWTTDIYDSKDRPLKYEFAGSRSTTYTYNSDGTTTETDYDLGTPTKQETRDKNEKLLKEKRYKSDGQLDYTVIPKYNKEGDVVKRDTIRNE